MEIYEVSTPADRSIELIKWLNTKGINDRICNTLQDASHRQAFTTVISTVLDEGQQILKQATDEELEGAFTLILSLLSSVPAQERKDVVKKLVDAITISSEAGKNSLVRLRILTNLYNNIKESTEKSLKLEVFHRIITYTTDIKALDLLQSYLYSIHKWNLTQQEAATLYLLVSTSYQRLGATEEEQYFLIKYLSTFENLSIPEPAMAVATHAARSAAINYIKSSAGSQKYHVPRLRAVRALANHSQYGRLYELVDIFAHKDLSTFLTWCSTNDNSAYLTEQGINKENSIETMRLLTLCSLSSQDKVLTYDVIANALQCTLTEVENWIVKGITVGLIDGRIDQANQSIVITRSTQRIFDNQAWKTLQVQLHQWKSSVGQLLRSTEDAVVASTR